MKRILPAILLSLAAAGCGVTALQPDARAQVVEVSPGGDPLTLLSSEGLQFEDSKAAILVLHKAVREAKVNTGAIFSEGVARELKAAGVFKDVVPKGGTLRLSFSDFNVQYNDGNLASSLPVYIDASIIVQVLRTDGGAVWSGRIWSPGEAGRREKLEDLAAKPELMKSFFEDFSRRFGRDLAAALAPAR
jgi:hypothetical protein